MPVLLITEKHKMQIINNTHYCLLPICVTKIIVVFILEEQQIKR